MVLDYKTLEECEVMGYEPDFNNMITLKEHQINLEENEGKIIMMKDLQQVKEIKTPLSNTREQLIKKLNNFRKYYESDFICREHSINDVMCECKSNGFAIALAISMEETLHHFKTYYNIELMNDNTKYFDLVNWWELMTGWILGRGDIIKCVYNVNGYRFQRDNKLALLIKEFGGEVIIR